MQSFGLSLPLDILTVYDEHAWHWPSATQACELDSTLLALTFL